VQNNCVLLRNPRCASSIDGLLLPATISKRLVTRSLRPSSIGRGSGLRSGSGHACCSSGRRRNLNSVPPWNVTLRRAHLRPWRDPRHPKISPASLQPQVRPPPAWGSLFLRGHYHCADPIWRILRPPSAYSRRPVGRPTLPATLTLTGYSNGASLGWSIKYRSEASAPISATTAANRRSGTRSIGRTVQFGGQRR
jgi:hypothetical protein